MVEPCRELRTTRYRTANCELRTTNHEPRQESPNMDRTGVISAIERFGIVAVIRIKEPSKLRAVVDAIAAGGVRALEVTMTVPGAVDLIRELAPTLPEIGRAHV